MEFRDLTDPPSPVLVIVAHPDDIDFGFAGTAAALTAAGAEVVYALVTSGEAGAPDDLPRDEVRALRQAEQQAAAAHVGVTDVRWLGHPDGAVVADLALRRDISRLIRQVRPQLVITQSPERRWDRIYASHPDHLATGEAVLAAAYPDAQNPHAHTTLITEEGLEPHNVPEVWVGMLEPVDTLIDITEVIDKKVAALSSHTSQIGDRFKPSDMLREAGAALARANDLPDGSLAEAFRKVNTA